MLGEKIARHDARVWLVNTGWTGGPYGVGKRMAIAYTRAMIRAALSGALDRVAYETDPIFNLDVPASCPDDCRRDAEAAQHNGRAAPTTTRRRRSWRRCSSRTSRHSTGRTAEVLAAGPNT